MLSDACERYVMTPRKDGRDKFFPDPGQLFDLCRGDVSVRTKQRIALEMARDVVTGRSKGDDVETRKCPLPTVAEVLAKHRALGPVALECEK